MDLECKPVGVSLLTKRAAHSQQVQVLQVSLREQAHSYRVKRWSHNAVRALECRLVGVSLLTKGQYSHSGCRFCRSAFVSKLNPTGLASLLGSLITLERISPRQQAFLQHRQHAVAELAQQCEDDDGGQHDVRA